MHPFAFWKAAAAGGSAPSLVSVDYTVSDTIAGDANQVITATGTNLSTGTALTLGGVACTNLVWGSTTVQFRVPALTAGLYDLVATTPAGSVTLTNAIEAWRPTTASTNLKGWYRGDLGVTQSGGLCSNWADQSGAGTAALTAASTARPTVNASGINGQQTLDHNGTNNTLTGPAWSAFITSGADTMVLVVNPSQYTSNGAATYQNRSFFGDNGGYCGLYSKTGPVAMAYGWDSADRHDNKTSATAGTTVVLSHRHSSGTLYVGVNGVEGTGAACGNLGALTGVPGTEQSATVDGAWKMAEIIIWDTALGTSLLAKCNKYLNYRYRAY